MGVYSTVRITRSKAQEMVAEKLFKVDNDTLARWVDLLIEERLFNCRVVPDGAENDEARLGD